MVAVNDPERDKMVRDMVRQERSIADIAAAVGVGERQVSRIKKRLGLSKPSNSEGLAPLEERLKQAAIMFEDGPSVAEVSRTLHISRVVLKREFPDKVWTREQSVEFSIAVRQANRMLRDQGNTERILPRRSGGRADAA